ncbi:MAG: ATP-dependent zinc metalloprotease FtsH [Caldilineales bacterium]|nr:ATP-dependent zinc metalloprotease FtsH [Caldilineales bacterium]
MNPNWSRNAFVYLLIIVAAAALFLSVFPSNNQRTETIDLTAVAEMVEKGQVESIVISGDDLRITLHNGEAYASRKDGLQGLSETFLALGVTEEQLQNFEYVVDSPSQAGNWLALLGSLLPLLFVGAIFFFLMRQAQGSNSQAMSFGKSKARMLSSDKPTVTFDDVAGCDEAKVELAEVVEFLKEPQKFASLGARIPKGVLMVGHPGTGKTLMAKAVAGEAGVPFFSISGSEFVEMFVGVGASRVRDLFEQAKRNSPCIVFIDEIDAVGRHRGAGLGGSHDEREQTLNQILVEMDGFDTDTNVIIIAATNRPDILDPALLRPGRFDRRVVLDRPDVRGRRAILGIHAKGKPLASDVDLDVLARATPGFVGADLENLVNEAAILAARRNRRSIGMQEFEEAIERVALGGPERKSRVMSDAQKRLTAYHEAGHAVVAKLLDPKNPIQKVTIIPRGQAAGYAWQVPEEDRTLQSKEDFMARISVALGGRIAEELVIGDISSGASSDLEQVTRIARAMVTRYGMSDKLGPMVFGKKEEMVFLGREISEQRDYSEEVAEEIDREVRRVVDEGYQRARQTLETHNALLELVAQTLMERESLSRQDFDALFETGELPADGPLPPPPAKPSPSGGKTSAGREPGAQTGPSTPPAPAPA